MHTFARENLHENATRPSGGQSIGISASLTKSIKIVKNHLDSKWVPIKNKHATNINSAILIAFVCLVPISSPCHKEYRDTFKHLKQHMCEFDKQYDHINGDLNIHKKHLKDYIIDDESFYLPAPNFYRQTVTGPESIVTLKCHAIMYWS